MLQAADVLKDVQRITLVLVEQGFVDDQNMPALQKFANRRVVITYGGASLADLLDDKRYEDMYLECLVDRNYNLRLLDGALVQMHYEFVRGAIRRHRLAFLPSPDLEMYQNNPDVYFEEILFAEAVERQVVTVPLRFDFDARSTVAKELIHPKSHLTLGQYSRCRIPASAPITPLHFMDFILRSFYNTAFNAISEALPKQSKKFRDCTCDVERSVVHVSIPSAPA
jgi:hypothetical protein